MASSSLFASVSSAAQSALSAPVISSQSSLQSSLGAVSSASSVAVTNEAIAAACAGITGAQVVGGANRVHNPFAEALGYHDADFAANVAASQQLVAANTALVAAMEMVKSQPTGVWLDSLEKLCGSPGDGKQNFVQHLKEAQLQAQQAGKPVVLTAVVYNLPVRDCVRQERIGSLPATDQGMRQYQGFIDRIGALAKLFSDVRVAVILEPTAFATMVSDGSTLLTPCDTTNVQDVYRQGLTYAIQQFAKQPSLYTYLDFGDPTYNGEQALAEFWRSQLLADGSSPLVGISLNVEGYVPLEEPFMLSQSGDGTADKLPNRLHDLNRYTQYLADYWQGELGEPLAMLVDTSRNGWGGALRPTVPSTGEAVSVDRRQDKEAWCNIEGSGLGEFPHYEGSMIYLWAMAPGISGGNRTPGCDPKLGYLKFTPLANAPAAGTWFHNYFTQLVSNAYPPLISPQ
jgi:cellulose 1,4-beta-cellobiosidase